MSEFPKTDKYGNDIHYPTPSGFKIGELVYQPKNGKYCIIRKICVENPPSTVFPPEEVWGCWEDSVGKAKFSSNKPSSKWSWCKANECERWIKGVEDKYYMIKTGKGDKDVLSYFCGMWGCGSEAYLFIEEDADKVLALANKYGLNWKKVPPIKGVEGSRLVEDGRAYDSTHTIEKFLKEIEPSLERKRLQKEADEKIPYDKELIGLMREWHTQVHARLSVQDDIEKEEESFQAKLVEMNNKIKKICEQEDTLLSKINKIQTQRYGDIGFSHAKVEEMIGKQVKIIGARIRTARGISEHPFQ